QLGSVSDVVLLPLSVYFCDNSAMRFNMNLRTVNDDGDKVLDLDLELEEQVDEHWEIRAIVDQWQNGAWDTIYDLDGSLCENLQDFGAKAWSNARAALTPRVEDECLLQPGTYTLRGFEITKDDYNLPVPILGKYRVTATFVNGVGDEAVCLVVELESNKRKD
ncbi:hypothetical protein NQ315_001246, partial [Exocentrus adspersus]